MTYKLRFQELALGEWEKLVLSQRCFVGLIIVHIAGFESKIIRHF